MTDRSVIHDTFTITRHYPVAPSRVFAAFASQDAKDAWGDTGGLGTAEGGLVAAQSPGGFPFCLVTWAGEHTVPPPLPGPAGGVTRVDTLCLDVPPAVFGRELKFWTGLTGQPARPAPVPGYVSLTPPPGWPARLLLQRRDRAAPGDPVRGHVDFGCTDPEAEAGHVALGARVTARQPRWTVLSDPAGREYCLVGRDPA